MNRSPSVHSSVARGGFTLTEILISIGIILLLAALATPVVQRAQRESKKAQCLSNLRAVAVGFQNFLGDNNSRYPGNGESSKYFRWMGRIGPYMDLEGPITTRTATNGEKVDTLDNAFNQAVFHCPMTNPRMYLGSGSVPLESVGIYGAQNKIIFTEVPPGDPANPPTGPWGISALKVARPSRTILLADRYAGIGVGAPSAMGANLAVSGAYPSVKQGAAANHRADGNPAADPAGAGPCNFLFCDGHVETVDLLTLRPFIDKSGSKSPYTFGP